MSKNEMVAMIETMNNYDDLAAKAKAKADAIREAIKDEISDFDIYKAVLPDASREQKIDNHPTAIG